MKSSRWLAAVVVLGCVAVAAPSRAADSFKLDGVHSANMFKIKHMGIGWFYGRFNKMSGSISFDSADLSQSAFDISIDPESVDTGNAQRDNHLRAPDFFDVRTYKTITFKSTQVEKVDDDTIKVTGDLTLHGVTKQVVTEIHLTGHGQRQGGYRVGFETQFTIKRSDFGMPYGVENGSLGDEVQISVSMQGVRS